MLGDNTYSNSMNEEPSNPRDDVSNMPARIPNERHVEDMLR